MLRTAGIAAILLTAEERPDWVPKSLNEWLAHEDRGTFDNDTEPAEQIERAVQRFTYYNAVWCETGEQVRQMKACLQRVLDRHVERARQRVREAEANVAVENGR
jgi:hypothetical protein